MNDKQKKEILKSVEIIRESVKYNMENSLECYCEVLSRLDLLTYLLIYDK